jgi:predicted outer membrane protein
MRKVQWMKAGLCAVVLFTAGSSFADGAPPQTARAPAATPVDRAFLARALGVNQTEIVLGQMAIKRGTTLEVRAMGEKMVQRHTELARQLRELAQIDPASEPPALSADQQQTVAQLAAVSAHDFDVSFKNTVGAGHVEELAMYRQELGRAADPRLSALATGRVTALQQSLASASPAPNVPAAKRGW